MFVSELPDIDWVPSLGAGVVVDLQLDAGGESDVLETLHKLTDLGRWSIQQATRNWHGSGPAAFSDVIRDWKGRYERIERVHHTEEFCYFDVLSDGFYTLSGDCLAG